MEIISMEKPKEEYLWEYIARCENVECQILLSVHESDVIAKYEGYDRDFQTEDCSYYFKCPKCGQLNELSHYREINSFVLEMAKEKYKRLTKKK